MKGNSKDTEGRWISTGHGGLRYRLHPTRKHGQQKDKYYAIRFKVDGKRHEQGLGWLSEGMTQTKALETLQELRLAARKGETFLLKEKRAQAEEQRQKEQEALKKEERENVTFNQFWVSSYLPSAQVSKHPATIRSEKSYYKVWISPIIGSIAMKKFTHLHAEKIKRNILEAGMKPKTLDHALKLITRVWNAAVRYGHVQGLCPARDVKIPKYDNRRVRYLSREEAGTLLAKLKEKSQQTHDLAFLALYTGARRSELFGLKWRDIDLDKGILVLRNPKNRKDRTLYMTRGVKALFQGMRRDKDDESVFKDRHGNQLKDLSHSFRRVISDLGWNKTVTDSKHKVVFHTLRHTHASWLVEAGVDLYRIKELFGHQSLAMTERYSHIAADSLREAIKVLEKGENPMEDNLIELKRA